MPEIIKGFIILAFIFIPLEQIFSLHKQKIFRPQWRTDVTYFFIGHFVGKIASAIAIVITFSIMRNLLSPELPTKLTSQPLWLQLIESVIIADIGYYIAHRLQHTVPWLWQFHAVHHSIEHLDWLAAVRVHPCDQIFTKTCQMLPLHLLGFTSETLAIYAVYSAAIAFLIHANIKLKFGILKWFVATPQFHHWHHSEVPKIDHKNFAAQFPILDLLCGTLYMPVGKMPHKYGVSDAIPTGYLDQLLYPFLRRMKNVR